MRYSDAHGLPPLDDVGVFRPRHAPVDLMDKTGAPEPVQWHAEGHRAVVVVQGLHQLDAAWDRLTAWRAQADGMPRMAAVVVPAPDLAAARRQIGRFARIGASLLQTETSDPSELTELARQWLNEQAQVGQAGSQWLADSVSRHPG